jgi:tRNA dimethylallyltransferase
MAEISERERPQVVILLGPTGVGKSRWAVELAETFGGEIINADSMQVYRYMDIGTAKPTREEQKRVRHHLIDLVPPDQPFHADLFRALGRKTIDELRRERKPIWVVGGTGLYIKALTQGLFSSPKIDPGVREKLREEGEKEGGVYLYDRLEKVDPKTASKLHRRDLFRIIRALEVFDSTGLPISFFRDQHRFGERPYLTLKIGLEMNREDLYGRIDQRVDQMIEKGFLQEVEGLLEMGYGSQLKPMRSLGYKQMIQFLSKEVGWTEAIRQMKRDTRHYARRQWTWFKGDPEVHWHDGVTGWEKLLKEVKAFFGRGGQGHDKESD